MDSLNTDRGDRYEVVMTDPRFGRKSSVLAGRHEQGESEGEPLGKRCHLPTPEQFADSLRGRSPGADADSRSLKKQEERLRWLVATSAKTQ